MVAKEKNRRDEAEAYKKREEGEKLTSFQSMFLLQYHIQEN